MPRRIFAIIALGMLATMGLWEGAKGVVLPHFLSDLGVSPAVGAAIFSAGGLGYFAHSLCFGTLSQWLGLKRMVAVGAAITTVMFLLFVTLRNPAFLYAAMICFAFGANMLELSTSLPISLLYGDKQSGMLNALHGFFGVGALSGTLLGALLLGSAVGWRGPLIFMGLLMLLWALYFLRQPSLTLPKASEATGGGYGPLLRDPPAWAAALALTAAVMGEAGLGLWLPSYLQEAKGLSEGASAIATTVFFVGFTATRLGGTWVVDRFGEARSVIGLAVLGLAAMAAMIMLPGTFAWLSAIVGAGVAIGFSTAVSIVARAHPERVNRVYSFMYSFGGFAGIVTGPLMGWVGERSGLTTAMAVPVGAYSALIVLMVYVAAIQRVRRRLLQPQQ